MPPDRSRVLRLLSGLAGAALAVTACGTVRRLPAAGVYDKAADGYLVSVTGYKIPPSVVMAAARHVSFEAPGAISLPIAPRPRSSPGRLP